MDITTRKKKQAAQREGGGETKKKNKQQTVQTTAPHVQIAGVGDGSHVLEPQGDGAHLFSAKVVLRREEHRVGDGVGGPVGALPSHVVPEEEQVPAAGHGRRQGHSATAG